MSFWWDLWNIQHFDTSTNSACDMLLIFIKIFNRDW